MTQKVNLYNLLDDNGVPINAGGLIDPATGAVLVKPVDVALPVYNPSGSTITKGALVYISGYSAVNGCPAVTLANATDATKPAELVVLGDILTLTTGYANGMASVAGAYNTSARTVGDVAYLSIATPGGIQWTAPVATGQQIQPVGVATSVATAGDIYFYPSLATRSVVTQGQHLVYRINQGELTATKNVYAALPLGFAGKVVGVHILYTTASTGSSGVGTLDFILSTAGQLQSTGPATVTVTLNNAAAVGTLVNQSAAPTLQNTFVSTDTLIIHYTQTTTFASCAGVFEVHIITN